MKKFSAVLLIFALCATLFACGKPVEEETNPVPTSLTADQLAEVNAARYGVTLADLTPAGTYKTQASASGDYTSVTFWLDPDTKSDPEAYFTKLIGKIKESADGQKIYAGSKDPKSAKETTVAALVKDCNKAFKDNKVTSVNAFSFYREDGKKFVTLYIDFRSGAKDDVAYPEQSVGLVLLTAEETAQ
ncbi:MAG: hypothetical protein LBN05_01075 [Oscillospiraceae bacterium]|jgi:hypothetical protein|nr:hypothetical protein [Oscillospiraceae bacterium]